MIFQDDSRDFLHIELVMSFKHGFFVNMIIWDDRSDFVQIGVVLSFKRGFFTDMIFRDDTRDFVQILLFMNGFSQNWYFELKEQISYKLGNFWVFNKALSQTWYFVQIMLFSNCFSQNSFSSWKNRFRTNWAIFGFLTWICY